MSENNFCLFGNRNVSMWHFLLEKFKMALKAKKKMTNKPLNFLYERKGLIRRQLKAHWKGVPGFAMEHYKCNYGKHSEMCSQVGSSGRRSNLATIFICSSKY